MSKCTAAQAVAAMEAWIGYCEKATSAYAATRDKSAYTKNRGSGNYTFAGYLCGVQGMAWCAAQVSLAIYDACGRNKTLASEAMYGVWPYTVCNQVWDAAPASKKYWSHYQRWTLGKGERKTYYPQAGDIIVFTDDKKNRTHTGMVYACDGKYVYTIEGNSGNMVRKRSYLLTSSYIYGWIRPNYAAAAKTETVTTKVEQYGAVCCKDPELHVLSKGTAGPEVATIQRIIVAAGIDTTLKIDGEFGPATKTAVMALQKKLSIGQDGAVGKRTWPAALKKLA